MAPADERWTALTEMHFLLYILAKCGPTIQVNDIAQEFGTTPTAVKSRIQRLKQKYKNEVASGLSGAGANAGAGTGAASASDEAVITPKKRKRAADVGEKASAKKKGKTAKVEAANDDDDYPEEEL